MRILFAINHSYLPQRVGGVESSTHEIAKFLISRGHNIAVISNLEPAGYLHIINRLKSKIFRAAFPVDYVMGYPVFRGWAKHDSIAHGLSEALKKFKPDIVLAQTEGALNIANDAIFAGKCAAIYLRDTNFSMLGNINCINESILFFANSQFTASEFYSRTKINSIVAPPLIDKNNYKTQSKRSKVLFINPHPTKGLEIALKLAEIRPDIPFIFQESWKLTDKHRKYLDEKISKLSNVTINRPRQEMKAIYAETRILLAPSQWPEAWGRVVTEAHVSGIPAIVSNQGGLPEAVGDGGIIIPYDAPIDEWASALSKLWDDHNMYSKYVKLAFASSCRSDIQPESIINKIEKELNNKIRVI